MKLIACGDSWVWGYELVDPEVQTVPISEVENDPYNIHFEPANLAYRLKHRYVNLLADKMNAEVIDLSKTAGSNQRIVHDLLIWLSQNERFNNKNNKDLFVTIGWTSPVRDYFYSDKDKKWIDFGPWIDNIHLNKDIKNAFKEYTTHLYSMKKQYILYIKNVILLEHTLKNLGINYIMHQAFYDNEHWEKETDSSNFGALTVEERKIFDQVDDIRFVKKHSSLYKLFNPDYKQYMYKWHPNEKGHKLIAEYLYNYCIENNLL